MAVSLIGQAKINESSPSYTALTGSNRLLVFVIQGEAPTNDGPINPSFGGVGLVDITTDTNAASGVQHTFVYAGYILEQDMPTGSQSLSLTTDGLAWVNNLWAGTVYTFGGVNQGSPINPSALEETVSFDTSFTSSNVTSVTNGYLVCGFGIATAINATEPSFEAGWTLSQWQNTENGGAWLDYHKAITSGASENVTITWNPGDSESGMFSMFGINPISSSVSITDVNGTESWADGDTGLVITGTGFV